MHHSVTTYDEYLRRLQSARQRWAALGFDTSRTRIGGYERAMEKLVAIGDYSKIPQVLTQAEADKLILLFAEIQEFLFVSEHVFANPPLQCAPRLKRLFAGPELAAGENVGPLVEARNATFELHIAAILVRAQLRVDITGITDVRTHIAPFDITIECKRPQSAKKIYDNIRRAIDQIEHRKANAVGPMLGVIALSIGRTITEGTKFLVAPNVTAMDAKLDHVGRELIEQHDLTWFKGTAVDGVLLSIATAGVDEGANRPYHAAILFVRSRPTLAEDRKQALRTLYTAVQGGLRTM